MNKGQISAFCKKWWLRGVVVNTCACERYPGEVASVLTLVPSLAILSGRASGMKSMPNQTCGSVLRGLGLNLGN